MLITSNMVYNHLPILAYKSEKWDNKKSERLFYIQWFRLIIIANKSKAIVLLCDIVYKIQLMKIYWPDGIC
jgi:hypothetical protein